MSNAAKQPGKNPVAAPAGSVADGVTIDGTGTVQNPFATVAGATPVNVDGSTIGGNGTSSPLHTIGSGGGYPNTYPAIAEAEGDFGIGTPIQVSGYAPNPPYPPTQVAPASSTVQGLSQNAIPSGASVITVQTDGPFTLTTEQWDAIVTGESGGLTAGLSYWLDDSNQGKLTSTEPLAGDTTCPIGYAISPTVLVLAIGLPFVQGG